MADEILCKKKREIVGKTLMLCIAKYNNEIQFQIEGKVLT